MVINFIRFNLSFILFIVTLGSHMVILFKRKDLNVPIIITFIEILCLILLIFSSVFKHFLIKHLLKGISKALDIHK